MPKEGYDMDIYEIRKINEHLILLGERIANDTIFVMTLVVGKEKAALIDTGIGIAGDLDQKIRELTNLPIIVLNTHGDADHVGGNGLFGECHISPADLKDMKEGLKREVRLNNMPAMSRYNPKITEFAMSHMAEEKELIIHDLKDMDIIQLGGVNLEVIQVPGHSPGSLCFIDWDNEYIITGDAICPIPWLWQERCTHIAEYQKALIRFREKAGHIKTMYYGHSLYPMPHDIVSHLIEACQELLDGNTQEDACYDPRLGWNMAGKYVCSHNYKYGAIIYDKNKL